MYDIEEESGLLQYVVYLSNLPAIYNLSHHHSQKKYGVINIFGYMCQFLLQ